MAPAVTWLESAGVASMAASPPSVACDTVGWQGRCLPDRNLAFWGEGGLARVQGCDTSQVSGYSVSAGGFRCVRAGLDPCRMAGDLGRCEGPNRLRCVDGTPVSDPCAAC